MTERDWLDDVGDGIIFIVVPIVIILNGNYLYLIKDLKANKDLGISDDGYIHYEEATEAAIKYCLTNLI